MKQCGILLSHSPSEEQLEELQTRFGITKILKTPEKVKEAWGQIPSGSELPEEDLKPVQRWIQEELAPGDLLWVQGEPTATLKMIYDHPDLTAISATSRREVVETRQSDGSVKRVSRFQHQGFRAYSKKAERPNLLQQMQRRSKKRGLHTNGKNAVMLLNFDSIKAEQSEELRTRFGVTNIIETPEDIKGIWKQIPPGRELPTKDLKRIRNWLNKVTVPGDLFWVQGEITATHDLISRFSDLTSVCATTRREVVETHQPDGSVKKTNRFHHAGFREYPEGRVRRKNRFPLIRQKRMERNR